MHRVLKEIESIIHKNIAEVLPNLSFDELEDDGTVFLMNGKNGTEFEWYVNEKLPVFGVAYCRCGSNIDEIYRQAGRNCFDQKI